MKKTFLSIVLFLTVVIGAQADVARVESMLKHFENSGQPLWKQGTQFMALLHEEDEGYVPVKFTEKTDDKKVQSEVYCNACDYFYSVRDYDRSIAYGLKGMRYCRGTDWEADCLNLLSMAYLGKSDYAHAAAYAKQCYALDAKTGDPDVMSSSLNTLAGIYMAANQPAEAQKYILKALEMAQKADNPTRLAVIEGMASEIYHAQVNDTEALKHIDAACELEKKLAREDKLAVRHVQKASILNGLKRFSEAEQLLREAIPIVEKTGDKHTVGIACNKMGMALFSQNRQAEAVAYFRRAADIFVEMGDMGNELHARRGLYESLWKLNPDSAKIELDRFDLLKDSLYRTASAESLSRFNAELDNDWLTQDNALKQLTISKQKVIIGLSLLAAILLALGVWWWMRRRMRIKVEALQVIIDELQKKAVVDEPVIESEENAEPAPETSGEALTQADREYLSKIIALVTEALPDGDLSVEGLATKMFTTRGNLNRKVKDIAGITTQQFVLQVRLEEACRLLRDSDIPITEVGFRCGFDSAVTFSRAFKRKTGLSPTQYRQKEAA